MQGFCPSCRKRFEVPDDALRRAAKHPWDEHDSGFQWGFAVRDRTFQIVDSYNPQIVYHECPGVPRNVQTLIYGGDDDEDGTSGVPARPPEPLGDPGAAMQREVEVDLEPPQ